MTARNETGLRKIGLCGQRQPHAPATAGDAPDLVTVDSQEAIELQFVIGLRLHELQPVAHAKAVLDLDNISCRSEAGDLVTAICSVAGGQVCDPPKATAPAVPVLHIHSVDDPRALWDGGLGPPFPLTNNRVQHPRMADVLAGMGDRTSLSGD